MRRRATGRDYRKLRTLHYILDGKFAAVEPDLITWAVWFETADRAVKQEWVEGETRVSTVFLGLDHNFSDAGPPLLFETMVFSIYTAINGETRRYATWEDAETGHDQVVAWVIEQLAAKT